jgi:hypothetical protein
VSPAAPHHFHMPGNIGSAGGGTGLFPSTPSLDQNEH